MNTKNVLIATGIATILLGSMTFAAVSGKTDRPDFALVQTAVEANSYASLPDTAKAKISETEFAEMVQKSNEHKAVENAINSGDYSAFKAAMIAQIPSETEFQKMVNEHKTHAATRTAIETAVKNNDFTAFKAAITAERAQMEANHPNKDDNAPKALSDAQLQKHFNSLVEYYKKNGKLPEMGNGFGPAGK